MPFIRMTQSALVAVYVLPRVWHVYIKLFVFVFQVPFSLMIQPVLVAVAGLFLGFLSLCIYGDGASFLVQVLAFAGQALATREPIRGQFVSNALEFIYVGSLIYMYIIQI